MKQALIAVALLFILVIGLIGLGLKLEKMAAEEEHKNCSHGDYQMNIDNDSIYIYDGDRLVGQAPWSDGLVDSIILRDNQ